MERRNIHNNEKGTRSNVAQLRDPDLNGGMMEYGRNVYWTRAEKIASEFDMDGQCWEIRGVNIEDFCTQHQDILPDYLPDSTRYQFVDGSAIILGPIVWDIGFPAPCECHCWQGGGHADDCEYSEFYSTGE